MPQTAFVTGATGFVGLNLVEALLAAGWRVVAAHRPTSDLTFLSRFAGVEPRVAPLDDPAALARAMPRAADAVFHVAASVSWWRGNNARQHQTNVVGTRNVVSAALERQARRLIHTSSIAAYGLVGTRVRETDAPDAARSRIGYVRTKHLAEVEVRRGIARGLEAVILNPANVVGPYDLHNWSRSFRLVATGKLPGVPPGGGSFCHVHDVVQAHLVAVERGRSGENYLLGGADHSFLEMFQIIGELLDVPVPRRATPALLLHAFGHLSNAWALLSRREPEVTPELATALCSTTTCDSSKAEAELGYRSRGLREMLADCHAWLLREGRV